MADKQFSFDELIGIPAVSENDTAITPMPEGAPFPEYPEKGEGFGSSRLGRFELRKGGLQTQAPDVVPIVPGTQPTIDSAMEAMPDGVDFDTLIGTKKPSSQVASNLSGATPPSADGVRPAPVAQISPKDQAYQAPQEPGMDFGGEGGRLKDEGYKKPGMGEMAVVGAAEGTLGLPLAASAGVSAVGDWAEQFKRNLNQVAVNIVNKVDPTYYERKAQLQDKPDELKSLKNNFIQEVSKTAYDTYKQQMDEISQAYPTEDITRNWKVGLDPAWWSRGIAQAATSISGAVITGGGSKLGGALVGSGIEALPNYEDLKSEDMDKGEAAVRSIAFGVAVAALEKFGLDKIFEGKSKTVIGKAIVGALSEASSEALEEPADAITRNLGRQGITPNALGKQVLESLRSGVNVFLTTLVTGGAMAGHQGNQQKKYEEDLGNRMGMAEQGLQADLPQSMKASVFTQYGLQPTPVQMPGLQPSTDPNAINLKTETPFNQPLPAQESAQIAPEPIIPEKTDVGAEQGGLAAKPAESAPTGATFDELIGPQPVAGETPISEQALKPESKVETPPAAVEANPLLAAQREQEEGMNSARKAISEIDPEIEVKQGPPQLENGVEVSPDGTTIYVSHNLSKRLSALFPGEEKAALSKIIEEEKIHQKHIKERGGKTNAEKSFEEEWRSATPEEQKAVRAAYGADKTHSDAQLGAELARMREQIRETGTITESLHPVRGRRASEAIDILSKPKSDTSLKKQTTGPSPAPEKAQKEAIPQAGTISEQPTKIEPQDGWQGNLVKMRDYAKRLGLPIDGKNKTQLFQDIADKLGSKTEAEKQAEDDAKTESPRQLKENAVTDALAKKWGFETPQRNDVGWARYDFEEEELAGPLKKAGWVVDNKIILGVSPGGKWTFGSYRSVGDSGGASGASIHDPMFDTREEALKAAVEDFRKYLDRRRTETKVQADVKRMNNLSAWLDTLDPKPTLKEQVEKAKKPIKEKQSKVTKKEPELNPVSGQNKLMGEFADLYTSERVEGMIYEVYKSQTGGIIRVIDYDANKVVTLKKFPSYNQAEQEYFETLKKAQNMQEKPKTEVKAPTSNLSPEKQARLKEIQSKIRKRLGANPMFDPEMLTLGAEMASIYVEGGVKTFKQFVARTKEEMGDVFDKLKRYLHGIWTAAGADNAELDEVTRAEADQIIQDLESGVPEKAEQPQKPQYLQSNPEFVREAEAIILSKDHAITKNAQMKKLATKYNVTEKEMQDNVEAVVMVMARDIARSANQVKGGDQNPETTFNRIKDLYSNQPIFSSRTSTSMINQAYSTPVPLSYLMGRAIRLERSTSVYEPTAGTGSLLVDVNSSAHIHVNELNNERRFILDGIGFNKITDKDATTYIPKDKFDSVMMNPPFGPHEVTNYAGFKITKKDHIIALKALESMKDDGTAAIVLGAQLHGSEIGSTDTTFLNYIYGHYNVADHFEVSGDLYGRQGAKFPVRILLINGRKAKPETGWLSPKSVDRLDNWDVIYKRTEGVRNDIERQRSDLGAGRGAGLSGNTPEGTTATQDQGTVSTPTTGNVKTPVSGVKSDGTGTSTTDVGKQSGAGVPAKSAASKPIKLPSRAPVQSGSGNIKTPRVEGTVSGNATANTDVAAGSATGSGGSVSGDISKPTPVIKGSEFQVPYDPESGAAPFGTLIPRNIAGGVKKAIKKLRAKVGDLDEFVANRLNMTTAEVETVFAAEQVDGIALTIDQIENGGSMIIADETGIGKGRQAAALIRYSMLHGKVPLFFTQDPKLFTDMYNDLLDIHTEIKPFILGNPSMASIVSGETINGKSVVIHKAAANKEAQDKEISRILENGLTESDYNVVFSTYSQIRDLNNRQAFLEKIAGENDTIVILDEAHNAAGDADTSMQAAFMSGGNIEKGKGVKRHTINKKGLLNASGTQSGRGGVLYMSATYAKRPDNMPVYFRTALRNAADSFPQLINAMKRGGNAILSAVSEALADAGQLIRRERDFTGVKYDMRTVEVDDAVALTEEVDGITSVLSEIVQFSKLMKSSIAPIQGGPSSTVMSQQQMNVTDFASIVHNQVSQMLLGAKANHIVEKALEAHKRGEKPVIAVVNTMESFIDGYIEEKGLKVGDPIKIRWNELLKYALSRTLRATIKDPQGNESIVILNPGDYGLASHFESVLDLANSVESNFPISPIDYIVQKLEASGVKMGELTGRTTGIQYTNFETGEGIYKAFKKANKNNVVNRFNGGSVDKPTSEDQRYDGMLLNASGSTGLSAHASTRFGDRRPRLMIIGQASNDINVLVQTLGRIKRTGMIPGGANYYHPVLPLQAELRPAMVVSKKMKSLNANTTAETDSSVKIEAEDILNKYGDAIVAEYLDMNDELQDMLDIHVDHNQDGSIQHKEGVSTQFTGRMALMPDADQKRAYDTILPTYRNLIQQLKATGEYDLEIVTHDDWDGIRDNDQELVAGTDDSNIFTASVRMQQWDIVDNRHVPTGAEMLAEQEKNIPKDKVNAEWDKLIETVRVKFDASAKAMQKIIDDTSTVAEGGTLTELTAADKLARGKAEKELRNINEKRARWNMTNDSVSNVISNIGRVVSISNADTGESFNGMLVNIKMPDMTGATVRVAPGAFKYKFMINAPGGVFYATAAQFGKDKWSQGWTSTRISELTGARKGQRIKRFFIVGNPIRGYGATGGRGKMVRFKAQDGKLVTGIQMPANWGPENLVKDPRMDLVDGKAASIFLRQHSHVGYRDDIPIEAGNLVRIVKTHGYGDRFTVSTSASRKTGGTIFLDQKLLDIIGEDFVKSGARMETTIDADQIEDVVNRIMKITNGRFTAIHSDKQMLLPKVQASNPQLSKKPTKGVGAAAAEGEGEFIPGGMISGLRESVATVEARSLGYEAEVKDLARRFPEVVDAAWTRMKNSDAADDLIKELEKNPRPLSDTDVAMLTIAKIQRFKARNDAASESNTGSESDKALAVERLARAEERLQEIFSVTERGANKSITETARGLSALRMMMSEQYDLVNLEQSARANNGNKPLTKEEMTELQKLHAEFKKKEEAWIKKQKELEAKNKNLDDIIVKAKAQKAFDDMVMETLNAQFRKKKFSQRADQWIDEKADQARARIKARGFRLYSGIDPAMLIDETIIGAQYIKNGIRDFTAWSKQMLSEFGQGLEKHLKSLWIASIKASRDLEVEADTEEVRDGIRDVVETPDVGGEKAPADISKEIKKLMRLEVENGTTDLIEALDNVQAIINDYMPEMTRSEVMRAFSDYGISRQPNADEVSKTLSDMRTQSQKMSQLEDIKAGNPALLTGQLRNPESQKARELEREVIQAMKDNNIEVTDPETQRKTPMYIVHTRLQNEIDDMNKAINEHKEMVKSMDKLTYDQKAKDLVKRRDAKRRQYNEIFKTATKEYKKRTAKRNVDLQIQLAKMKAGTYVKPTRTPVPMDAEALQIKAELEQTKRDIHMWKEHMRWKNLTKMEKVAELMAAGYEDMKTLKSAVDDSFLGRQGMFVLLNHPDIWVKGVLPSLMAASRAKSMSIATGIENNENYLNGYYKKAKLSLNLHEGTGNYGKFEDNVKLSLVKYIPGVNFTVDISNRMYATAANVLRTSYFDRLLQLNPPDPTFTNAQLTQYLEDIGKAVNSWTGRGDIAYIGKLNKIFWAPSLVQSAVDISTGRPVWGSKSPEARKVMMKEYTRTMANLAILYAMAAMLFGFGDDDDEVELDMRSSDFGSIPIGANHKINPLSFVKPVVVFMARLISGQAKVNGEIVNLRSVGLPFATDEERLRPVRYGADMADTMQRFERSKLHPTLGFWYSVATGKGFGGKELTPGGLAVDALVPLAPAQTVDMFKGENAMWGTVMNLANFFGFSINQFFEHKERKSEKLQTLEDALRAAKAKLPEKETKHKTMAEREEAKQKELDRIQNGPKQKGGVGSIGGIGGIGKL